jgi:regulator of protease activity HflC (stomatin/prohibitin superfamily)
MFKHVIKYFRVKPYEKGFLFRDGALTDLVGTGSHWFFDPLNKIRVDVVSERNPWLHHAELDVILDSGLIDDKVEIVDLKDHERALVWVDGRFEAVLEPGLYALWKTHRVIKVEVIDSRQMRFEHGDLNVILEMSPKAQLFHIFDVEEGQVGLFTLDGEFKEVLAAGRHVFWKSGLRVGMRVMDLRELSMDVAGQEIMTRDKVSLRMNALVTYRVADAKKAFTAVENFIQALYRDAQLALRAVVGTHALDALLAEKDTVSSELEGLVKKRAAEYGVAVKAVGIRDLILPGEMKELLNQVVQAKKAAEAALITRREETAAMRSQANTAKLLENNSTLMRLKELEALVEIAKAGKLQVVLGEKGLSEKMMTLI